MAPLVSRLDSWLAARTANLRQLQTEDFDRQAFATRVGYWPDGRGNPEVIVGEDVAVDLGHPRTASESFVLLTTAVDAVVHGRIRWLGSDLPELPARTEHAHAQIVILRCRADALPDPFAVEAAQYLTHRLEGYMVRSVPGRLWVRISRAARARGLDFETVGRALIASYADGFTEIDAVEVVFVTGSVAEVQALAPIAAEARIMAGSHRKLVLAPDGEYECDDLDCERCEEKPVCDSLREVVIKRRRRRRDGAEATSP
jgi:hypothetical protein